MPPLRYAVANMFLLLNNDAQLMSDALDILAEVLSANPNVAAVGPKICYP